MHDQVQVQRFLPVNVHVSNWQLFAIFAEDIDLCVESGNESAVPAAGDFANKEQQIICFLHQVIGVVIVGRNVNKVSDEQIGP